MPKQKKSTTTRKPPEPLDSHAEIEKWMKSVMPDLQPVVRQVDRMIRDSIDGLQYAIKWKKAYYGLPSRGWIIEMVAYDVSVNVVFLGGKDFDSPPPEGTTGRTRYIKIRSVEEAKTPELSRWIKQAARVPGWE